MSSLDRPSHPAIIKAMRIAKRQEGFTLIELVIVIILLCLLLSVVALTYSGVQAKNRNNQRQSEINTIKSQLEAYYVQNSKYPSLNELNDTAWRTKNLPDLKESTLQDPRWSKNGKVCNASGNVQLTAVPEAECYSYQVTGSDGSVCDNGKVVCAQYTLTAMLEGGDKYVKSSLN